MGTREVALRNLALADPANRKGRLSDWRKVQNAIAEVFWQKGGAKGLFSWVESDKSNERDFYNHICRSLGSKIDINLQGSKVLLVVDDMSVSIEGEKPIENAITLDVPDDE